MECYIRILILIILIYINILTAWLHLRFREPLLKCHFKLGLVVFVVVCVVCLRVNILSWKSSCRHVLISDLYVARFNTLSVSIISIITFIFLSWEYLQVGCNDV